MPLKFITILICLSLAFSGNAQNRVLADGQFDDWTTLAVTYSDSKGDGGQSGIDFGKIQIANDPEHLFLFLETGTFLNLQDFNEVTVYLDIDNNVATGTAQGGIGADLTYTFGSRSGTYHPASGGTISVDQNDIGLVTAPTMTSDRFEIAIKRSFRANGNDISMQDTIKVIFRDNEANGDQIPSSNGGLSYGFLSSNLDPLPGYSMSKPSTSDLRIVSYNVERDGLFETNRNDAYTRIFEAIQPDIIGIQEVYNHSSSEVANKVESILPSAPGEKWHHAMAEPDCHAISRYPILASARIEGSNGSGNGAFLIDLPDSDRDMLLIVAHPPCCGNNAGRQTEMDLMMQFVREAKAGNGPIPLKTDAPIVILGDMNLVGDRRQLTTLLSGDISDETGYGQDFRPDWDGNDFLDSQAPTTGVPFSFTWYSANSSFSPGRLDYVVYSGSNLQLDNSYSLFTPGLFVDSLSKHKLNTNDALIASDHLPVVTDFTLKDMNSSGTRHEPDDLDFFRIYPNPTRGLLEVEFAKTPQGKVDVLFYNIAGKILANPDHQHISANRFWLDLSNYPKGTYILKILTSENTAYKKVVLRR